MADLAYLGGRYDPALDLQHRWPAWRWRLAPLAGLTEVLSLRARVILLDWQLTGAALRSNLAHAVAHIDLRHRGIEGPGRSRLEREAECLAATRCISTVDLQMAWWDHGADWTALAARLRVDEQLVKARVDTMGASVLTNMGVERYGACARSVDAARPTREKGPHVTIRAREPLGGTVDHPWGGALALVSQ